MIRFKRRTALNCLIGLLAGVSVQAATPIQPEVLAKGLHHPWAMAFLSENKFLVTERRGDLRVVRSDGSISAPLKGVPAVAASGQGGLLDLVLDEGFSGNRRLYFCFSESGEGGSGTAVAAARLSEDETQLSDVKVLFRQHPKVGGGAHFGCRIAQGQRGGVPDGTLLIGLGDRFSHSELAQDRSTHIGKLIRISKDGSVPGDNPFVGQSGASPAVFSLGHRNIQGLALDPKGEVWLVEHGPQGGDELNQALAGKNYGWPVITHGERYGGGQIGEGTHKAGLMQPVHYWVPSIAPSGLVWLKSNSYGESWQGSLLVGSLKFRQLIRMKVQDGKVVAQEALLQSLGQRIRDVREGRDGLLYVLTDDSKGQLIRLNPAP